MKEVSVIIPNYNGVGLLPDCLTSLTQQSFKNFEIIVVDNNSSDNSLEYIKNHFSQVKIIKLTKNYGFAKAINEGVKASQSKYVVFLNNDTEVAEDWLKNLVKCAKLHKEVISVNSKILNFYNRKKIDGIGITINEVGQARSIGYAEEDLGQFEKEQYIFGATGGASLFIRSSFLKVGLFDENFFMYSEEVDFAFRAQFLGYKSIYCPKAVVYHKHKATAKKEPQFIEYWQFKNMTQVIIKDFPKGVILKDLTWLKIILVHLNTIIYQIKNGFLWPPLLTECWLVFNLPKLLKERKKIQSSKKMDDEYMGRFFTKKEITFWGLRK